MLWPSPLLSLLDERMERLQGDNVGIDLYSSHRHIVGTSATVMLSARWCRRTLTTQKSSAWWPIILVTSVPTTRHHIRMLAYSVSHNQRQSSVTFGTWTLSTMAHNHVATGVVFIVVPQLCACNSRTRKALEIEHQSGSHKPRGTSALCQIRKILQ